MITDNKSTKKTQKAKQQTKAIENLVYFSKFAKIAKISAMKINNKLELQNVRGEYLLIPTNEEDAEGGKIISIDPIAAMLWEATSKMESFSIDNMIGILLDEYDVDEATAREDCQMIAECWSEMGIIEE